MSETIENNKNENDGKEDDIIGMESISDGWR